MLLFVLRKRSESLLSGPRYAGSIVRKYTITVKRNTYLHILGTNRYIYEYMKNWLSLDFLNFSNDMDQNRKIPLGLDTDYI